MTDNADTAAPRPTRIRAGLYVHYGYTIEHAAHGDWILRTEDGRVITITETLAEAAYLAVQEAEGR